MRNRILVGLLPLIAAGAFAVAPAVAQAQEVGPPNEEITATTSTATLTLGEAPPITCESNASLLTEPGGLPSYTTDLAYTGCNLGVTVSVDGAPAEQSGSVTLTAIGSGEGVVEVPAAGIVVTVGAFDDCTITIPAQSIPVTTEDGGTILSVNSNLTQENTCGLGTGLAHETASYTVIPELLLS